MGTYIIKNNKSGSQCISYYILIIICWMITGFSFLKLNKFEESQKLQGWSILLGYQKPRGSRNLLGHMIAVLRLKYIVPTNMLL